MGLTAHGEWGKIARVKGDDDLEKHIMGVAYNNIIDGNLALEAGYKSAPEFIAAMLKEAAQAPPDEQGHKVRDLSVNLLASYGATARAFSAEEFSKYGQTALFLLLRYRKAAGVDPNLPAHEVMVNLGGEPAVEKPFPECTVRELRAAIAAHRPATDQLAEADQEKLELLNLAIDVVLGTEVRCDATAVVRNKRPVVDIKGVPLDRMEELLWSMLEVLQTD